MTVAATDNRILALFDGAAVVETPTPGMAAWIARDPANGGVPVLVKRTTAGVGKGRMTSALALQHPNVVPTRRWLADGGQHYVIRDVVRGKNLRQILGGADATRVGADGLRRFLLPVIDALEYAHGQGLPHGGVSPENVLVAETDGIVQLSDFGTIDPDAPLHRRAYKGESTIRGDVAALCALVAEFLPATGTFGSPVVRGRIQGILTRCDSLADLRETLNALERFVTAPTPRPGAAPTNTRPARQTAAAPWDDATPAVQPILRAPASTSTGGPAASAGRLTWEQRDAPRVALGVGGAATLVLGNAGDAPIIVRMVATQHAWLNVRLLDLPLTIPQGGSVAVSFAVSGSRLAPGEYRSEVYLSANARESSWGAPAPLPLPGGWYRHTAEIRVFVGGSGLSR
jgi:hypothetical protein